MSVSTSSARPRLLARPLYRPLRALAAGALVGALASDIAYALTADFPWVDASDWLVAVGVGFGLLALIVGAIEGVARRNRPRPVLPAVLFDLIAWLLALVDLLIHTRDGWTSVMPWGLALSALIVVMLIVSEWAQRMAPAPLVVEGGA